jgi:hypothetical protein
VLHGHLAADEHLRQRPLTHLSSEDRQSSSYITAFKEQHQRPPPAIRWVGAGFADAPTGSASRYSGRSATHHLSCKGLWSGSGMLTRADFRRIPRRHGRAGRVRTSRDRIGTTGRRSIWTIS